jgi:hypothetical protein
LFLGIVCVGVILLLILRGQITEGGGMVSKIFGLSNEGVTGFQKLLHIEKIYHEYNLR